MTTDLTYTTDGIWTRFYPNTPAGTKAWDVMAEAMNGSVAFLPAQVPSVKLQLKEAGLSFRKALPRKPLSADDIDAMLAELVA